MSATIRHLVIYPPIFLQCNIASAKFLVQEANVGEARTPWLTVTDKPRGLQYAVLMISAPPLTGKADLCSQQKN